METINPGLAVFLGMLGIFASACAGIYIQHLLRNNKFMRSDYGFFVGLGCLVLAVTLATSFAVAGHVTLAFAALLATSAVFAALIFSA